MDNLQKDLKINLETICSEFTDNLKNLLGTEPIGTCYLIGHCLAEGLKKAGFKAKEITGTAVFKDKNDKNIIYGISKSKGMIIGVYHTWCVLELNNQTIIIDPSIKFNKIAMRCYYKIKPNKKLPDFIITPNQSNWLYTYIEDISLKGFSKDCLQNVDPSFLTKLIDKVESSSSELLGQTNTI